MDLFKFFKKDKQSKKFNYKAENIMNAKKENSNEVFKRHEFTPEHIDYLLPDEIFVFGSNLAGRHDGGAARTALRKFGAIYGQGNGLQGQSYGIPTMHGGLEAIAPYVDEFIDFAKEQSEKFFYVTRIGCGIAGFRDEEVAPFFKEALDLDNICLPKSFVLAQNNQTKSDIIGKPEISKPQKIQLSKTILDSLSAYDIIYAEFAEGGAMGAVGNIMIYIIKEEQFICYSTNLFNDENTYERAQKFILSYQNTLDKKDIQINEVLFHYYYGGFGNHVFINKNAFLKIANRTDGYFIYRNNNKVYQINASCLGVFDGVVNKMQTTTKK